MCEIIGLIGSVQCISDNVIVHVGELFVFFYPVNVKMAILVNKVTCKNPCKVDSLSVGIPIFVPCMC